jgi:hypothetical protein
MPDPPRVVMRGYGVVSLPICIAQFGSDTKAGIVDLALTTATVEHVSVAVGLIPFADIELPCLATSKMSPSLSVVGGLATAGRNQYSAKEKIRIVLDGLRGEVSIAELGQCEGIAESPYYN